jgi:hypothetical protein
MQKIRIVTSDTAYFKTNRDDDIIVMRSVGEKAVGYSKDASSLFCLIEDILYTNPVPHIELARRALKGDVSKLDFNVQPVPYNTV